MPGIVMQTWANVTKNFIPYLNLFSNNFVATTKDKDPFSKKSLEDIIKRYIDPYRPQDTKEKSEKEIARSEAEKQKLEQEIISLRDKQNVQDIIQQTVSIPEAQTKIKQFLNS